MKKTTFVFIAFSIGLVLQMALLLARTGEGQYAIPVLMMLFISELGFLLCGAGLIVGGKTMLDNGFDLKLAIATSGCAIVSVSLAINGYLIWEQVSGA